MKRSQITLALVAMMLISVLAASFPLVQASTFETKLVLMTPISRSSIDPVVALFTSEIKSKRGVDITVEYSTGGSPTLYAKVLEWNGKPAADVFWGGEYNYYTTLTTKDLLEAYKSANFGQVPESHQGFKLKDSNGNWMAVSFFSPGIMYNKDALKRINAAEPKTWDDLLKPVYKASIVMTTPARSGGLHVDVELLLQSRGEDKGWAYWRRLAGNVGAFVGRSLEVSSAVQKGEYAIGIAIAETSAVLAVKAGAPTGFTYPSPSVLVPSPIAILKGAKNMGLAKEFMDFILSKQAQESFLKGGLVPARSDIRFSDFPNIPDARILKQVLGAENVYGIQTTFYPLNFDLSDTRFSEINTRYDDFITKKLDDLKKSWDALLDSDAKIKSAREEIQRLEQQAYDVSRAKETLASSASDQEKAYSAFDRGDFASALQQAQSAGTKAQGATGFATPIPFYVQYAAPIAIVVVLVLAASAALVLRRRSRQ